MGPLPKPVFAVKIENLSSSSYGDEELHVIIHIGFEHFIMMASRQYEALQDEKLSSEKSLCYMHSAAQKKIGKTGSDFGAYMIQVNVGSLPQTFDTETLGRRAHTPPSWLRPMKG